MFEEMVVSSPKTKRPTSVDGDHVHGFAGRISCRADSDSVIYTEALTEGEPATLLIAPPPPPPPPPPRRGARGARKAASNT